MSSHQLHMLPRISSSQHSQLCLLRNTDRMLCQDKHAKLCVRL
uniref:Uncharacterized protein n=1 Tax=Anguilla anguilla TaxID=7936 RepID=A0A0E9XR49_ANGAN